MMMLKRATFALIAVAAGGCSHQASDAQSAVTSAPQATVAQTTAAPAMPVASPPDAGTQPEGTGSPAAASDPAIASSDGDTPGLKVELNSLVRGSDTVTLKFTVVNNSPKAMGMFYGLGGSGYAGNSDASGVNLIDTVSKKKYFPLADTDKTCICSHDIENLAPGTQVALWVKYPAPPPSVAKISVDVPHFIPLDDVPISQ